jgi:hypothetical protein
MPTFGEKIVRMVFRPGAVRHIERITESVIMYGTTPDIIIDIEDRSPMIFKDHNISNPSPEDSSEGADVISRFPTESSPDGSNS